MPLELAVADVLAAMQAGADEASGALGRALDGEFAVAPGEEVTLEAAALPEELAGAGLCVVLKIAGEAAVLAFPESSGLLPAWYAKPDATGTSKLTTLAQELGMLVLPEAAMPDDFAAFRVNDLAAALVRGEPAETISAATMTLSRGETSATAWLIWPLAKPAEIADPAPAPSAPAAVPKPVPEPPRPELHIHTEEHEGFPPLPTYTKSLLKIRVPISVTLATSKQPLNRIVELAPGSIIPFDKSCDDTLCLEVNNRPVAVGEAVKVGDKFGLRITSIILPPERFVPLRSHGH
jgi:flagellar motor switch protein FliN/FliY